MGHYSLEFDKECQLIPARNMRRKRDFREEIFTQPFSIYSPSLDDTSMIEDIETMGV